MELNHSVNTYFLHFFFHVYHLHLHFYLENGTMVFSCTTNTEIYVTVVKTLIQCFRLSKKSKASEFDIIILMRKTMHVRYPKLVVS